MPQNNRNVPQVIQEYHAGNGEKRRKRKEDKNEELKEDNGQRKEEENERRNRGTSTKRME